MPFTPKFVDLVRNYTTTTGTADFRLGSVVNGYLDFAATCQVGDQFYYSAIGVDKPTEREVGRGTLLANGVIQREPINGGKTNFSTGTKSVALIAAAEWFSSIQTGSAAAIADRTALAAHSASTAYLREKGREGTFVFDPSDLSAEVALDPQQGVYIAPANAPTGGSGAWVRSDRIITPYHFGAVGDGAANDKAALDALCTWFFASPRTDRHADFTGNFGYAGTFNLGPASVTDNDNVRYNVRGDLRIVQKTAGTFETIKPRNLALTTWHGRITAQGIGGTTFASRSCAIGISFVNCPAFKISGGLRAYSFWFHGIAFQSLGSPNSAGYNDAASIGPIRAYYCGSGLSLAGFSLTANWSAPVNNGSSNSATQTTTIAVDAMPDPAIETYLAIGGQPVGVVIAGQFYYVQSWNRSAGTVSVYPWLDNAAVATGSGTLRWVFGAGVATWGVDSGILTFDHIQAIDCGIGILDSALYGSRFNSMNLTSNGIGLMIGGVTNGAHIGTSVDALYSESNDFDIAVVVPRSGNFSSYVTSSYALDLAKCFALAPRLTDGRILGSALGTGQLASDSLAGGMPIMANGQLYSFHKRQIGNEATTAMTFREHGRPPRILTQAVNTQTVTFAVVGSGEYNRLFGYNGATLRYVGTGTNGAPTGSFTFVPPAGGTVNGGAANASAVFSNFTGPVDFECYHTDTAQLTWIVRQVAGGALLASNVDTDTALAANSDSRVASQKAVKTYIDGKGSVLAQSAVAVSHTGDTSPFTFATIALPAGAMGANGQMEVEALFSCNNTTGSKTFQIKFGSAVITNLALASQMGTQVHTRIANRNAQNSQVYQNNGITGYGNNNPLTSAVDTSAAVSITLTGQLANSADTCTLESYRVTLYPKA